MEYNLYPIDDLLTQATIEQIKNSLTIRNGNAYIRLFNSREHWATVPAVFPNLLYLKKTIDINSYSNVRNSIYDYLNGAKTGNRKTELLLQNPIDELALIGMAIDDNNTTTL